MFTNVTIPVGNEGLQKNMTEPELEFLGLIRLEPSRYCGFWSAFV